MAVHEYSNFYVELPFIFRGCWLSTGEKFRFPVQDGWRLEMRNDRMGVFIFWGDDLLAFFNCKFYFNQNWACFRVYTLLVGGSKNVDIG